MYVSVIIKCQTCWGVPQDCPGRAAKFTIPSGDSCHQTRSCSLAIEARTKCNTEDQIGQGLALQYTVMDLAMQHPVKGLTFKGSFYRIVTGNVRSLVTKYCQAIVQVQVKSKSQVKSLTSNVLRLRTWTLLTVLSLHHPPTTHHRKLFKHF